MNDDINTNKRSRGRPAGSQDFRTVAVPNEQPDIRKLARALLALAGVQLKSADKENSDDAA